MYDNYSFASSRCHNDSGAFDDHSNACDVNDSFPSNGSSVPPEVKNLETLTVVLVLTYLIICLVGLAGNSLVVAVVVKFAKMKTVTNIHILNLSVADTMYLVGLPMLSTTVVLRSWVFGPVLCKVYYILTSINMFTGTFTLTLMSADRFVAVWYPIKSLRFRAAKFAAAQVVLIWIISIAVMFPIVLFTSEIPVPAGRPGSVRYSCQVLWPAEHPISAIRIYTVYTFVIGFLVPVALISVFYLLLVLRLRSNRINLRSRSADNASKRGRPRRSVTTLVTIIISVFIVCWLPYWVFQVRLVFGKAGQLPGWSVFLFQFFTVLTYSNSAVNPLLYAFTNDVFRKAFLAACRCHRFSYDPEGGKCDPGGPQGATAGKAGKRGPGQGEVGPGRSKRRKRRRMMQKTQTTRDFPAGTTTAVVDLDDQKIAEPLFTEKI